MKTDFEGSIVEWSYCCNMLVGERNVRAIFWNMPAIKIAVIPVVESLS